MSRIPLSAPDITDAEQAAVARAMRSGWVAPVGPDLDGFESELAAYAGASHGVALSSGTAALHLGLLAAGVGPGSIVPTSTMTFVATANAISYTGATPLFIDSEPETGNMDVALLEEALTDLHRAGVEIGAIVPVDLYGKAADHTRIRALGDSFEVPVISDSAESLGATHAGRPVGAFGRASAVSFNGNKIMTTSSGGMLLTDDDDVVAMAKHLSTQARLPGDHYVHAEIGFNYRMSNVLAALGRAQLTRLDEMIARRRAIRDRYREVIAPFDISILGGQDDAADNCWFTNILLGSDFGGNVRSIQAGLEAAEIETRQLWRPMHTQPIFRASPRVASGVAEDIFRSGLSLPSGSGMTDGDIDRVCETLARILEATDVPA